MRMRRRERVGCGSRRSRDGDGREGHARSAQNFPSKPIRWVIPFAAGGNYDVTSRLVGEAMGRRLGQTVVPDNRPGAGGIVGLEVAANAPADGYTVVMGSFSVLWIAPYLAGKPSMVPLFAPISLLTTVPMVIVTRADSRFADMKSVAGRGQGQARHGQHRPCRQRHHQPRRHPAPAGEREGAVQHHPLQGIGSGPRPT